ncbi:probable LRR receptor-like serine/threonine-protein kinase At4g29180 [Eucalyptus grandis]|uniref:probable LRR receptor-like serine/threonine-protein kinase At4g29180 n=1 Tax=Eucalyptus grandis TaxID=71139 RepID=UPI00192EAB25|nr:probable LRR receptor-like serine/threonine-protein kinase At4g29180 [Eucalyptus grandis]
MARNLSSSNLVGKIASSFSKLSALESLDLSNNQLSGEIPETLAKLPKLRNLYLSGNNLTGLVPRALKRRVEDKTLYLRLVPSLTFADLFRVARLLTWFILIRSK